MRASVVSAIAVCIALWFQASDAVAGQAHHKKPNDMQVKMRQVGPVKKVKPRGPEIVYLRAEIQKPQWVEKQFEKLAQRDRWLGKGQKVVVEPAAAKTLPPKASAKKRKVASN